MNTKISVIGSIALDTLETPNGNRDNLLGGSAIYFSIAASIFSPVEVIGVVGTDFPKDGWDLLKSKNISTNNIIEKEGNTFRWGGRYNNNYSQRETLFTKLGVFDDFVPIINSVSNDNEVLFLANIQPSLQLNVLEQLSSKIKIVISDTMNLWIDTSRDELMRVIKSSDIFLLNDEEAIQLTGLADLSKAGKILLDWGPGCIIIKLGSRGSMLFENNSISIIPCVPNINVIDPTGAGDSFAGGLVGYMTNFNDKNMINAILYASSVASFTVSDFGINKIINLNLNQIEERVDIIKNIMNRGIQ